MNDRLTRVSPGTPMGDLLRRYWHVIGAVADLDADPAPLLPRHELFARDDMDKTIDVAMLPCNWLQCMDNSLDPIHYEHLHGAYGNYVAKKLGKEPPMDPVPHVKIDFDVFKYGIYK